MSCDDHSPNVMRLLAAVRSGDRSAEATLFSLIYEELHRLATSYMRRERPDHTLQPTALVHEAYLSLMRGDATSMNFTDQRHFIATAASAMRHILVNHAAAKNTQKRGGKQEVFPLDSRWDAFSDRAVNLVELDDALRRLAEREPVQARLVELHFFGGMTFAECGELLGLSQRAVYYEWSHARAWLRGELDEG